MQRLSERGYAFSVDEFHRAARSGDAESVEEFLAAGMAVDVTDAKGVSALGAACTGDAADVANVLLQHGANIQAPQLDSRTPIMLAAASGSAPLIRLLLEHGADALAKDPEGWHPLALATWHNRLDAASAIAAIAPANELDDALLLAALQGNIEMTDMLLRRGASVLAHDAEGRTPLMIAASHGFANVVKRLLDNGANRFALHEASGQTPAQFAAQAESEALAKGDIVLAGHCREVAGLLAAAPVPAGEPSGVFDDPREIVTIPPDGPDEATAAAISSGQVRLGQSIANATLPTAKPGLDGLAAGWKVKEYREHPVPLVLSTVDSDGATAHFRQLFGEHASIQAKPGQSIPGTNWKLITAQRKFGKQKDDGAPLDLSSVTIEFAPGAAPRSLVAGTQGTLDEPIAVLTSQTGSQTLIARRGDTFKLANQPDVIRINDISPDSVVVENLTSRETRTLPRR